MNSFYDQVARIHDAARSKRNNGHIVGSRGAVGGNDLITAIHLWSTQVKRAPGCACKGEIKRRAGSDRDLTSSGFQSNGSCLACAIGLLSCDG